MVGNSQSLVRHVENQRNHFLYDVGAGGGWTAGNLRRGAWVPNRACGEALPDSVEPVKLPESGDGYPAQVWGNDEGWHDGLRQNSDAAVGAWFLWGAGAGATSRGDASLGWRGPFRHASSVSSAPRGGSFERPPLSPRRFILRRSALPRDLAVVGQVRDHLLPQLVEPARHPPQRH